MRILMYADGFGVGTQTFISQDATCLSQKHDLLFVCTKTDSLIKQEHVKVQVLNFKQSYLQKKMWKLDLKLNYHNKNFQKELNTVINNFCPDIIHCQFGIEAIRLIDNLDNTNIPIVIQFRGYDASKLLYKKSYVKRLQEILNRGNYYSIFVSNSLKENLMRYKINVKNSMVLYSGIDLSKFKKDNDSKHSEFIFLQISSLNPKKGHEYTLKAFSKFLSLEKTQKYKLILTGDGKRKIFLMQLAKKLDIENNVQFVGFVSHAKAKTLLENADVFVHHSITPTDGNEEGIPNALIEAMAMELPVLSTYHAGIPELVQDGINGYLVEERDIDTYVSRMQDITKWGRLKQNREKVEKYFEIKKHISKLETFYLQIIEKNNI